MHQAAAALATRLDTLRAEAGVETPLAMFVPVDASSKKPSVKHAGGLWSHEKALNWIRDNAGNDKFRIGMLLYGLIVIDFDRADLYPAWEAEFPEMAAAPAERTKKGIHVYFLRCPAATAERLVDGPLRDPVTKEKADIDCKTITGAENGGHYTGSLIVCAPTPNYEWLPGRSLMELGVSPMSPALLKKVVQWRRAPATKAARPRDTERSATVPAPPTLDLVHFASEDELKYFCALLGFPLDGYSTITRMQQFLDSVEKMKLRLRSDTSCHICGDKHTDVIFVRVFYNSSRDCYCLRAYHIRDKKCKKDFTITVAAESANKRRFESTERLPQLEAAPVARLFESAGVRTQPGGLEIWKLPNPAPGFTAHVMLVGEDAWRMLMTTELPDGSVALWWRTTKYPGLKYEFLQENLWTARSPGAPRPPFWPPSVMEEDIGPSKRSRQS